MFLNLRVFGQESDIKVIASEYETLEEVVEKNENKFNFNLNDKEIKFIFNGHIVNPKLTISYHHIANGNTIILFIKQQQNKQILQKVEEVKEVEAVEEIDEVERRIKYEESIIDEECRLADLGFSGWECDQHAPRVFSELYASEQARQEEEENQEIDFEQFIHRTVISQPTKICDKPLPHFFLSFD